MRYLRGNEVGTSCADTHTAARSRREIKIFFIPKNLYVVDRLLFDIFFSIDDVDAEWIKESQCVIIGSPTYYTDSTAKIKEFMEGMKAYGLAGKLGGAFASAKFVYGGGEMALQTILTHMLFFGMMVYSSGSSAKPPIHMGPVAIDGIPETKEIFAEYGRRMAKQAKQIF